MFRLSFEPYNAVFDLNGASETARLLRDVAARYEQGEFDGPIIDKNGTTIGGFATRPPPLSGCQREKRT